MSYDVETLTRERKRKALLVAATALVVIAAIVALIVFLVLNRSDDTPGAAPGPSTATEPSDGETTVSPEALDRLTWVDSNGVAVPVSADSGPRDRSKGLASGFSRDPLGALLAAIHIIGNTDFGSGSDVFVPTIRNQMVGDQLEKFLASVQRVYEKQRLEEGVSPGEPLTEGYGTLLGFRIEHYDGTYAASHLLVRGPSPDGGTRDLDFRVEVRWVGDDWKALVPVDETWNSAVTSVSSTDGYTKFPKRR